MNKKKFFINCYEDEFKERLCTFGSPWTLCALTTENTIVYKLRNHKILVVYIPEMKGLGVYVSFSGSYIETLEGVVIKGSFLVNGWPIIPLLISIPVIIALLLNHMIYHLVFILFIMIVFLLYFQHLIDTLPIKGKQEIESFFQRVNGTGDNGTD